MSIKSIYRTHSCAELRPEHVGQEVKLSGWILRKRNLGGVFFVDLRDNYGVTQIVFFGDLMKDIDDVRVESVISVTGKVILRAGNLVNNKIPTGHVEIYAESMEVLSTADLLPFQIAEDDNAPMHTRLKYRFLELRREKLHNNMHFRAQVIAEMRAIMIRLGFTEFQTPILTSSSPEGARDFLVPSRIHPGKFFALPQAPQQFKQLLMVSGFDRYFQIAACFRDEDARVDRTPGEFYQLDFEMSFVEQDQVLEVGETVFYEIFAKFGKKKIANEPFPRISYRDAIELYGTDKPDLRIEPKLKNVNDIFTSTEFKFFRSALDQGGSVIAVKFDVDAIPSRKTFDTIQAEFEKANGFGVAYLAFEDGAHKGSMAKFVSEDDAKKLKESLGITKNCVVFMAAGEKSKVLPAMGRLRVKLGNDFDQVEKDSYRFCIIVDFPMYEKDEETGEIVFSHNPFSMPSGGMDALLNKDPLDIMANQYDFVCNGYEMASGAVRNHKPEIMYKAFEIAGHPASTVDEKFGGMISAFKFGAPPHAGMAPGIDRTLMLLADEENIRDVILFPMAPTAEDLMMGAPSLVSEKQLKDVHIGIKMPS